MKYCGKCGAANNDNMNYCCECGEKLESVNNTVNTGYRVPIYETKIVQVDNSPEIINASNELWSAFGWNVQNIQVTHSQNTKTYTKDFADAYNGIKTVETTTINYATITYQRDKNMPNYSRIVQLEEEYDNLNHQLNAAEVMCTVEPFNYSLFLIGLIFPPYTAFTGEGGMKYLKKWRKEKEEAEKKQREYSNSEFVEKINSQKQAVLAEVSRFL